MIRKDHLLKLLQQLDEALKKISGLKHEGNTESALEVVEQSYAKLLGIGIPDQEDEQFLNKLLGEKALEFDELNVLAHLLKEEGDLYFALDDHEKSLTKYHQALDVFEYLNKEEKVFSFEREAKISEILERMRYTKD
jgi:tetratricopeptide (TPR) repeat protein